MSNKHNLLKLPPQNWNFVSNDKLRSVLARDYEELGELLKVRAPKSIMLMCGSILEATLVSILTESEYETRANEEFQKCFPKIKNSGIEDWKLYQLIRVSAGLGFLPEENDRIYAQMIRDYRNLIHPKVEFREEYSVDQETAGAVFLLFTKTLRLLLSKEELWDEKTFFRELRRRKGSETTRIAKEIYEWATQKGLSFSWGRGRQSGSFTPRVDLDKGSYNPITVWTDGKVQIRFGYIMQGPPFSDETKRMDLLRRLNSIHGVSIRGSEITKFPTISLVILKDKLAWKQFQETLDWVVDEIRSV